MMTRFFPILDAIAINKNRLAVFERRTTLDLSKDIYIANDDLYCKKCSAGIKKYRPCYVEFFFANKNGKKGLWSITQVLCMKCASKKIPMDYKKVKHYEL